MTPQTSKRIAALDALRGIAIIAMASYHLSWDLSWFGFVSWNVSEGHEWRIYAGSIAGSFLFLAGVSLALAHGNGIRWRAFWKREAIIVAAAALVSVATYFVFGQTYVRFGILHSIAAGSLIALPFLRLPGFAALVAALVFALLPVYGSARFFDGQFWLWTGLGTPAFGSVDYVPLAPWAAPLLAGLGLTKLLARPSVLERARAFSQAAFFQQIAGKVLVFFGRKSLTIYLLHQPVLYGIVWTLALATGAPPQSDVAFLNNCTANCSRTFGDEGACRAACSCTTDVMRKDGSWDRLLASPDDPDLRLMLNQSFSQCLRETPSSAPKID